MATLQELKDAIDGLLNLSCASRLLQLNSDTPERAYEVYVLSLCVAAVERCGGSAETNGINSGASPPILVFRGSPGAMASRTQDFCYVDCTLGLKQFEIHVDVIYEGQSGANHEIDISFCLHTHGEDIRGSRPTQTPRTNQNLFVAIECKFYESVPGVSLARTFAGLVRDCSANRLNAFVSNRGSAGLKSFLSTTWAPKPFTDLTPLSPDAEQRFVLNLEQILRQWMGGR